MRALSATITRLPLLVGVLFACAGDTGAKDGWSGSVETLPNGTILIRNETPVSPGTAAWNLEETTRIGSLEGEGPAVFGAIAGFDVDALGRVFVLDRQAQEIRVFDVDGRHVRTFGRPGRGPGELTDANGIRYDGDGTVWVSDRRAGAYVAFDTSGAYVRSVRRRLSSVGFLWMAEFGPDGVLLESDSRVGPAGESEAVIVAFRLEGAEAVAKDTFPLPASPRPAPEPFTLESDGRPMMFAAVPFAPTLARTIARGGRLWFGITDEYRLYERRLEGDTVRIVERPYAPRPVTDADIDEALEAQLRRFVEAGGQVDRTRIPRSKPIFTQLDVDFQGNLWVRLNQVGGRVGTTWDVFDAEGRYLGDVHLPDVRLPPTTPVRPIFEGDAVWILTNDEFDVPQVVRYSIRR
jgi:sugar lactone lactonase YvrE